MVATFILTRAFAISALFVGAFPIADAAPVPVPSILDTVLVFASRLKHPPLSTTAESPELFAQAATPVKRSCRQQGCLKRRDAETVAEVLDNLRSATSAVGAVADEKRSCRPQGCLRELAFGSRPPSIDAFARAAREKETRVDEDLVDIARPSANNASSEIRSCRQQGCLRELDPAEANTAIHEAPMEEPASDAVKETRSCRQQGCLRDLDTGETNSTPD